MKIRKAVAGDVASLAALAESAYRAAFGGIIEADILQSCDQGFFATRFQQSYPRMLVAESERHLLGFSLVSGDTLDMLFVAQEASGLGVGSALLARAEEMGASTLESFADNKTARAFYERRGWRLNLAYEREFLGRPRSFVTYVKVSR